MRVPGMDIPIRKMSTGRGRDLVGRSSEAIKRAAALGNGEKTTFPKVEIGALKWNDLKGIPNRTSF